MAKYYRFWRHERILDPQILNQAQTGDLLIFRTRGTLQNLQRSVTRSDFDHIVMFLKNPWDDLMLLESSNQFGVITFSYSNSYQYIERFVRAKSYRNYDKYILTLIVGFSISHSSIYQRPIASSCMLKLKLKQERVTHSQ